jgi:tetratricopeptide (TPR) repeat protein
MVGRFEIQRRLGAGSMGAVFLARDPALHRSIALKLIHPAVTEVVGNARMLREARAMARLSHPNVVPILDVGLAGGSVFIAMQYVAGGSMRRWLQQPRSIDAIVALFVQAGRGLAAAHAAGWIHRDFKPDNVLVDEDGRAYVADFGLARSHDEYAMGDSTPAAFGNSDPSGSASHTQGAQGTPGYMAPEQLLGGSVGPAADQFAFCVSLYEAVFGERPFGDGRTADVALKTIRGLRRSRPAGAEVPRWLERLIDRGLHRDAEQRWPSIAALVDALERGPRRRRVGILAAGAMLVAGIVAVTGGDDRSVAGCSDSPPALYETWNPERKRRVKAALSRTATTEFGRQQADTVAEHLDAFARLWGHERSAACEALGAGRSASASLELDRRLQCLDRRLARADQIIDVLEDADPSVAERAPAVVERLSDFSTCTQPLEGATPRLHDPEQQARVARLRQRLERVEALEELGRYQSALSEARPVLTEARRIGDPLLIANARLEIGRNLDSLGQFSAAELSLLLAWHDAISAGDDRLAVSIASQLVYVEGARLGRPKEARTWERHARSRLQRLEDTALAEADLDNHVATVHFLEGDVTRALERWQRAAAAFRRGGARTRWQLASTLNNLSIAQLQDGKLDEARETLLRSIEIKRELFGDSHPGVATSLGNLGEVEARRDDWPRALEYFEEALDRATRAWGADHSEVARFHANVARALTELDRPADALVHYERLLQRWSADYGVESSRAAYAHLQLGDTLGRLGRYDEGEAELREAIRIYTAAEGANHSDVAEANARLDHLLQRRRGAAEASTLSTDALAG